MAAKSKIAAPHYVVQRATFFGGVFFDQGDVVDPATLGAETLAAALACHVVALVEPEDAAESGADSGE